VFASAHAAEDGFEYLSGLTCFPEGFASGKVGIDLGTNVSSVAAVHLLLEELEVVVAFGGCRKSVESCPPRVGVDVWWWRGRVEGGDARLPQADLCTYGHQGRRERRPFVSAVLAEKGASDLEDGLKVYL